ncbi:MAG: winged helix-turn-helix transcriptional regulator [Promethearchaeota archaeon]
MDSKDLEIIKILMKNSRSSLSRISETTGITVNAVKKRISNMEREGVIQGFTSGLGYGILGEETGIARIGILGDIDDIKALADSLGAHELIFIVMIGIGNSLVAVFSYKTSSEVVKLESWLKSLPEVTRVEMFLLFSAPLKTDVKIAPVDYKIISVLKNDARMTLQQLAQSTKISPRTLKKRINRMVDLGLVQFSLKISPGSSETLVYFVLFCMLDPKVDKIDIFQKIMTSPESWTGWIVVEKPMVIVCFFAPGLKHVRLIEEEIKQNYPVVSINSFSGGEAYYYEDWRDKHVEDMARKLMVF